MIAFLLLSSALATSDITEVWVQTRSHEDRQKLYALGLGFAESMDEDWVLMHSDSTGLLALQASGLNHRYSVRKSFHEDGHLEPDEMVGELRALASEHPLSATLVHLGWSVEDRPVYALRISHTPTAARSVRILAAHHGDETSSAAVAVEAARNLLVSPTPAIDAWLDHHEVWVVPHVNPDGIAAINRYNANNVDLNRNYGFMWSAEEFRSGDVPFSEPETRNIRALGAWVPAGLGLSLHSGATNLGWV